MSLEYFFIWKIFHWWFNILYFTIFKIEYKIYWGHWNKKIVFIAMDGQNPSYIQFKNDMQKLHNNCAKLFLKGCLCLSIWQFSALPQRNDMWHRALPITSAREKVSHWKLLNVKVRYNILHQNSYEMFNWVAWKVSKHTHVWCEVSFTACHARWLSK